MHIVHLEQQQRLIDNAQPVPERQSTLPFNGLQKPGERNDALRSPNFPDNASSACFLFHQHSVNGVGGKALPLTRHISGFCR